MKNTPNFPPAKSAYRTNVAMLDDLLDIELGQEHSKLKPRMTMRIVLATIAIALYEVAKPSYRDHVR